MSVLQIPDKVVSNDILIVCTEIPAHLETTALSVVFRNDSGGFSFPGTSDSAGNWRVELNFTDITPSDYWWQAFVLNSDNEKTTIANGVIQVLADFSEVETFDGRTNAQILLTEIEAAIKLVLEGQAYKIKEREFTRANLSELIAFRDKLKWEVAREKNKDRIANGLPDSSRIQVRFSS